MVRNTIATSQPFNFGGPTRTRRNWLLAGDAVPGHDWPSTQLRSLKRAVLNTIRHAWRCAGTTLCSALLPTNPERVSVAPNALGQEAYIEYQVRRHIVMARRMITTMEPERRINAVTPFQSTAWHLVWEPRLDRVPPVLRRHTVALVFRKRSAFSCRRRLP